MTSARKHKEFYEKPTIVRHSVGTTNRFGRLGAAAPHAVIDGVPVEELLHRFGSPLYVVSEATLRAKYQAMLQAFSLRYPRVIIAYSYKTNYLSAVCSVLKQMGAWAEVVSGMEYEMALALDVPGDQIVFNGPLKRPEELARAISQGAKINIDSYDELTAIEEIAQKMGRTVPLGVRVNMTVGPLTWDRFGFNLESGQALQACQRVMASPALKLAALHCHIGTFVLDTNLYNLSAERLGALAMNLADLGVTLEYVDIGGGYASRNVLHDQWMPAEYATPSFEQYADAICPALINQLPQPLPALIIEPGRSIVDEAMHLITTVVSTKVLSSGQKGVVLDAGINLMPTVAWYRHEVRVASESGAPSTGAVVEEVNLYGPLCMNIDVLQMKTALPPVRKGAVLVIRNVGAYNFTQSMQFIQPRPGVVMVNGGEAEYIRMPENTEYIRQLERVPKRLASKSS